MRRTAALLCLLFFNATAIAAPPQVTISYRPSFDAACALVRGYRIEAAWKQELSEDLGRFRDMWARIVPRLLSKTEELTGKHFADESISAYVTLCDPPSQAFFGITVNMRYALSSFTKHPVPLRYKIGTLYHEVLHKFVDAHVPAHSALLARH